MRELLNVPAGGELEQAIQYLITYPPRIQVTPTEWREQALFGESLAERAIDAACRVRNNLFHGGKFFEPASEGRDQLLVAHSLAVLHFCLECDEELRNAYHSP
ncbi:MAG: hypothetical protein U1F39_16085 [Steroidobacteraceae bacterium]